MKMAGGLDFLAGFFEKIVFNIVLGLRIAKNGPYGLYEGTAKLFRIGL